MLARIAVARSHRHAAALIAFTEGMAKELDPAWNIKVAFSKSCRMTSFSYAATPQITLLEPGWIRSECLPRAVWSVQNPAYANPDLAASRLREGPLEKLVAWKNTRKSVEMFYKVASLPDPPLHFVLGRDAIDATRKKIAALTANIDTYEALSEGLEE